MSQVCLILIFIYSHFIMVSTLSRRNIRERNIVANAPGLNCTFITIIFATASGWLRATVLKVLYNLSIVGGRSSHEKRLLTIVKRYI